MHIWGIGVAYSKRLPNSWHHPAQIHRMAHQEHVALLQGAARMLVCRAGMPNSNLVVSIWACKQGQKSWVTL